MVSNATLATAGTVAAVLLVREKHLLLKQNGEQDRRCDACTGTVHQVPDQPEAGPKVEVMQ